MTEITDADRKAAAGFFRDERTNLSVKFSLGANPAPLLEAFAAHRMQERDRVVAWLRGIGFGDEDQNRAKFHIIQGIASGAHDHG